jgi:glycosyl transferase family 25
MIKSPIPIYIISLKSRADRRKLLIDELNHIFTTLDQVVVVVDSLLTPRNGAIGCASSHAYALSRFMFETDSQCCLILEDDFQCLDVAYFINSFLNFLKLIDHWDVALLAHNQAIACSQKFTGNINRVINAQTASAYMVNRNYAPQLIHLFYHSSNLLRRSLTDFPNATSNHLFAIDMLWKNEQITNNYLATIPAASFQRADFSNIENNFVDYKV